MSLIEIFAALAPANLRASLAKPRPCNETFLRMHLDNRLYFYGPAEKKAGIEAAMLHFGEHHNMDRAIRIGADAARDYQP